MAKIVLKCFFIFVFLFGIFSGNPAIAQNNLTQEQMQKAVSMQEILEKASNLERNFPDSALFYYQKIFPENINEDSFYETWINETPEAHKYYVAVAMAHSGLVFLRQGQRWNGVEMLEQAHKTASLLENNELKRFCTDNLAVFYAQSNELDKSAYYFEKSLNINHKLGDTQGIIYCLGNLGAIHANMNNLYGAAHYFEQLLNLQQNMGIEIESIDEIINIAMLYTRLNEHERATRYWDLALKESEKQDQNQHLGLILSNLGSSYFKLEEYNNSLDYYTKCLDYLTEPEKKREKVLAYNNIAIINYHINDLEESSIYWNKALEHALQTGQGQVVFDALINLSNIYNALGKSEKSIKYYEQYLALAKQIDDPIFTAKSLLGMGDIQKQAEKYDTARDYYIDAYNYFTDLHDYSEAAKINELIAATYFSEYNTNNALHYYRKNLETQELKDSLIIATSLQGIADTYRMLLQLDSAAVYYSKALDIFTRKNHSARASSTLNSMAYIEEINGNLPNAIQLYERALELAGISGNREAEAAIYNNLGVIYRQLGDLPRAQSSYIKAMDIYQRTNNQDAVAYCYNNLGIIYELTGDFENASLFYEKSLEIKKITADRQGLATSFLNIGNIHKLQGRHNQARDYYEQALEISEEINDNQGIAVAYANLAGLYIETGEYYKTIGYANLSKQLSEEGGFLNTLRESYRQLAWAFHKTDDFDQAEAAYLKVIYVNHEEVERNFSILSESEKELFFKTVEDDFARFHSFALDRIDSNPEIAGIVYNNLLKNKGLLLKSSTAMRNAILNSQDERLINTYEQWIQLKQEIAQLYTLVASDRKVDINILEEQANNLERSLVRNSYEFSQFSKSLEVDWLKLKNELDSNEVAIEFTNFKHKQNSSVYCALIVSPLYEYPLMITLFLESELEEIMGTYTGNNYHYINSIYGRLSQPGIELYELIWMPLENYLKDINRIYLSPSGLLHKTSFAAINYAIGHYISDDYELINLSTTANCIEIKELSFSNETSLTLFGGIQYNIHSDEKAWRYLPGTMEEITLINNIAREKIDSVLVFHSKNASEETFKEFAPNSNILHIATHGFFFPDPELIDDLFEFDVQFEDVQFRGGVPGFGLNNFVRNTNPLMRSGLVFAGVNDFWSGAKAVTHDDGVLTSFEIINIDLRNTDLVVMSACETGLGEIKGSEGVYGLQRAFKMAGVNYLIMSLWQIPDKETAEFMNLFYEGLINGNALRQAFSNAQKAMRDKYDPFFWAAFVLIE